MFLRLISKNTKFNTLKTRVRRWIIAWIFWDKSRNIMLLQGKNFNQKGSEVVARRSNEHTPTHE